MPIVVYLDVTEWPKEAEKTGKLIERSMSGCDNADQRHDNGACAPPSHFVPSLRQRRRFNPTIDVFNGVIG